MGAGSAEVVMVSIVSVLKTNAAQAACARGRGKHRATLRHYREASVLGVIVITITTTSMLVPLGCSPTSVSSAARSTQPYAGASKITSSRIPVLEPSSAEEKRIDREVDAQICAAYRRWRAQGNTRSEHMEGWCPTRP
jgi:hypothetical protein